MKKIIGLSLLICAAFPVQGEDLVDVYRLALLNDPAIEVARYTRKVEEEKYPQALAGLLPEIGLTGSNSLSEVRNKFSTTLSVERDIHSWNWTIQLTQPLYRMQNYHAYRESRFFVQQALAQYKLAEQDLILRLTQAYFGVMSATEEINVVELELAAAKEQLRKAESGYKKGIMAIAEVYEARANIDLARSNLVASNGELDTRRAELEKIIDVIPEPLARLSPEATIPPPVPGNQSYWVDLAKQQSPIVRVANLGLIIAETVIKKNRSEHSPTLDLIVSLREYYSDGSETTPFDYATAGDTREIGIQFNLPLYSGGATSSRVAEAIANKYRAGAELEVAVRQATTDAKQAYTGVLNGLAEIAALKSAVKSGQTIVEESRAGFKMGLYDNYKVLDAEQKFFEARRDLIKTRYETIFQGLKLKAAIGDLKDQDLINVNSMLIPQ